MDSAKIKPFINEYFIHSYEADLNGNAFLASILQYFQEIAWTHAELLGVGYSHFIKKNLAWILCRISVKINSYPKWGEKIYVETWPTGMDNLYCYRDFKIYNDKKEIIGKATSTWFVVDILSRRPQRTNSYIDLNVAQDVEKTFENWSPKISLIKSFDSEYFYDVKFSDIDVNGHVNNVNYLKFVIDTINYRMVQENQISDLHINFVNEALIGERLKILSSCENDFTFSYSMQRENDKRELCKMIIVFQKDE